MFGLRIYKDGTVVQRASWIEGGYEFQRSKRLYSPIQRIYFSGESQVEASWSIKPSARIRVMNDAELS